MAQYTEYLIASHSTSTSLWWESRTLRKMTPIFLTPSTNKHSIEQVTQSGFDGAAVSNAITRDLMERMKREC